MSVNIDYFALQKDLSRSATIKIAASNAMAKSKAVADYVCTGENDEAEINAAIESLDGTGGCVELSEGTFNLWDSIFLPDAIWLRGQGAATKITAATALLGGIIISGKNVCVSNLNCNNILGSGIHIQENAVAIINNCFFIDNDNNAISILGTNCIVTGNWIKLIAGGIVDAGVNTVLANNVEVV